MRTNRPTKIITHHSAALFPHTALDVDDWHKERWPGFTSNVYKNARGEYYHAGYHFIFDKDGTVTQTRSISEEGAHCIGQNTSSIGVCFLGHFDHEQPTAAQIKAWRTWYKQYGNGMPVYPHRMYANKSCHGLLLPDDYFARLAKQAMLVSKIERLRMLISRLQALLTKRRMK